MRITDAQLKRIYAHAAEAYPYECFGFMIGMPEGGGSVRRIVPGTNLNTERTDRFQMDPKEFVQVEKEADRQGFSVIGFYHSHPDWPAIPSQTDIAWAWEGSHYLIVSIHQGRPFNTGVWSIAAEGPRRFVQEPLEILAEEG
jgi:proteasome lid subunit RPN8/RPN11